MANLMRLIQPTESDYVEFYGQLDFISGLEANYSEQRTLVLKSNQVKVEYNKTQWYEIIEQYTILNPNNPDESIAVLYQPSDESTHIVITSGQLSMLAMIIDPGRFD